MAICISNTSAENAIRPFTLDRKLTVCRLSTPVPISLRLSQAQTARTKTTDLLLHTVQNLTRADTSEEQKQMVTWSTKIEEPKQLTTARIR